MPGASAGSLAALKPFGAAVAGRLPMSGAPALVSFGGMAVAAFPVASPFPRRPAATGQEHPQSHECEELARSVHRRLTIYVVRGGREARIYGEIEVRDAGG